MKKLTVLLIAAITVCAALCAPVSADGAAPSSPVPDTVYSVWDGSGERGWYNGGEHAGTEEDPYVISTESDLYGLSQLVSEGVSFAGSYIVLDRDMYMNALPSAAAVRQWGEQRPQNVWSPIGASSTPFKGSFDGRGHAVFGLYTDSAQYAGLFGYTQNADITDVSVSRSYISSSQYAGSVVAYLFVFDGEASVENCFSDAFVTSSVNAVYCGGIVGYSYAYRGNVNIENCVFAGCIAFSSRYSFDIGVGGVVGYARSLHDYGNLGAYMNIVNCKNTADVTNGSPVHSGVSTGGIVGIAEARNTVLTVSGCRNSGEITGTGNVGGIVGRLSTSVNSTAFAKVVNCSNISTVTGSGHTGGLVGTAYSSLTSEVPDFPVVSVEQSFNSGVVVGKGTTGGLIGAMFSVSSNVALLDSFSTGRIWSTLDETAELNLGYTDVSSEFGGASSVVGKLFAESSKKSFLTVSRVYTTAEYTERSGSASIGYIFGNCVMKGNVTVSADTAFCPKTGYPVVGTFPEEGDLTISCRALEPAEFENENNFTGFDLAHVWVTRNSDGLTSPELRAMEYEKTFCLHTDCSWTVIKKATCTESGTRAYMCSLCAEIMASEEIPATGHTPGGWFTKKNATCTENGEKARYCVVCGEEIEAQTLLATGHKPSDWTVVTPPTCTGQGIDVVVCSQCGLILNTRHTAALGHSFVTGTVKEPSYTEDGIERKTCERCGLTEDTVIPMLICLHEKTEVRTEKEATCGAEGLIVTVCTVCGRTLSEETVPKLPHGETETVITPATCTAPGILTVRCKVCGEELSSEQIPAAGHVPGNWTVNIPATCLEGGEDRKLCTVCGEVLIIRQTAALGHTAGAPVTVTEPTCTAPGTAERRCVRCGKVMSTEGIPRTDHVLREPEITPAGCTSAGRIDYRCKQCGEIIRSDVLPPAGHIPGEPEITPAGCVTAGKKTVRCSVCGELLSEEVLPATGHTVKIERLEPTEDSDGYERRVCEVCGLVLKETILHKTAETGSQGAEQTDHEDTAATGSEGSQSEDTVNTGDTGPVQTGPGENTAAQQSSGTETAPVSTTSTVVTVVILIVIITVFAAVCIVIIVRSNKKSRLDR